VNQQPLVQVHLLGFPVEIHRRAGEHSEALRRELAFVEHAHGADAAPARLEALTAELAGRYGELTTAQSERIAAAIAAGEQSIDLLYELPDEVVDGVVHLGQLLDELDELCRDGALLTMVTPPDLLAFRRWVVGEIEGQIRERRPPRPWNDATIGAAEEHQDHAAGATVRVAIDDDLDLATAPALRKTLVEAIDKGATRITLDLSRCTFLDSTGLSLLVTTHHRLAEDGGGLRLEGLTAQVKSVLEMAGATEFFDQA
jgi:anti-sigma B factor antagonist